MQIFSVESNNSKKSVNLVVTKGKNLQQFNGHLQHWIEAKTKSDSQVESLINVAEFKADFMGKSYYY